MDNRRRRGRGNHRHFKNYDDDNDFNFPPHHRPPQFWPHSHYPHEVVIGPPHFDYHEPPYGMFHHGPPHWPHWGFPGPHGYHHGPWGYFPPGPHDFLENDESPNFNLSRSLNFQQQIPREDFSNEQMRKFPSKDSDLKSNITINLNFKDNEKKNNNNEMNPNGHLYNSQNINIPQKNETTFNPIQAIRTQDIETEGRDEEFSIFRNKQTKSNNNQINKPKNEEKNNNIQQKENNLGNEFPAQPIQAEQAEQPIDPEAIHEHELNYDPNINNVCTICYNKIDNKPGYKCEKCAVVLCEDCSNQVFDGEKKTTLHPHQLLLTNRNNWSCDICNNSFKKASSFYCKKCNFDACYSCYIIPINN